MTTRSESDTAWKDVLDANFPDFVEYCLPKLNKLIDWNKKWSSLDKEFQAITKGTESGKRLLDKLYKVYLKDGREQWVLVHLEVQSTRDDDFPKRMFTYAYRIFDKYQQPVVSCAVLTDENKKWQPNSYEVGLVGSYLRAEFLVIKLIDYKNKRAQLEASSNPFASVIMVQLAALEAKKKPHDIRKQIKYALTKRLYDKGFDKKQVINLYKFIDWLIGLPPAYELEYLDQVYELEESKKMPYISSAERFGKKKGMEEGIEKATMKIALSLIEEGADLKFIAKVTGLKIAKLKELKENTNH